MVYKATVGVIRNPHDTFWKLVAGLFILLSVFSVLVAWRCSQTLVCLDTYTEDGVKYCISEIKV